VQKPVTATTSLHRKFPRHVYVAVVSLVLLGIVRSENGRASDLNPSSASRHQWGAVTLFHGLPSDHVRAITQDADGIMWFGTDSGLVKYDGRRVQRVAVEGPASTRILSLRIDREGVLWIGTDQGAARLVNGQIKPIAETQQSVVTSIITSDDGQAMMVTDQGEIFACTPTSDGSLSVQRLSPDDHPLLTIESRSRAPLRLTSLALIDHALIVGTRSRGLISIDTTQMKPGVTRTAELVKEVLSRPRAFFIHAIETDSRGRFWFGAETSGEDSGLYGGGDLPHPDKIGFGTGTVNAIKADHVGNIWVGTETKGVFVYRDGRRLEQFTFENTGGGLLSNRIYSVFLDREGVAWFGTDRGVCRYDPNALRVEAISTNPESNFARTLFQSSDGTLWCGTNRGLFARDKDGLWREARVLKGKVVHSIAVDSQGRLIIGTAAGLFVSISSSARKSSIARSPAQEFSRILSPRGTADNIRAITNFRGCLYIANFGSGIERVEGASRIPVWPDDSIGSRERQVVSLHADGERLWIGTVDAGAFFYDGRKTDVDHSLDDLVGAAVWSIAGATDRVLWLASARGLYALKGGALLKIVDGVDARSISVYDKESSNAIWCASVGGGLYRVKLNESSDQHSTSSAPFLTSSIDTEQGMPSLSVFAVESVSSETGDEVLWIGTSHGIARYKPSREAPVLQLARVIGKRVYGGDELRDGVSLEYPQNSLSLDVAAISSRTFPEQFQYVFTVFDHQDRVVREKSSRESQLLIEGLKPGSYRVAISAFTNDLVASRALQFHFTVARAPFPWTSTALSVLLGLALMAMWWGYRQNRRLSGANQQLAETRMQLANETETERRRIARDLHDQTLADLRRLMMLTDKLPAPERQNGHVEPSQFRAEIESVSTEIRRICEDLSPSALANVGLVAALEWALADAVAHQPEDKRFEYECVADARLEERLKLDPATQIQVYRIVQEALSNTCRHSSATRVKLALEVELNGDFVVRLEDDGCGFNSERSVKAGRGLTNIRSRASLIEGIVDWNAVRTGGTIFSLRLNLQSERPRF
jgi:signal transduction histidine kinase